MWFYVVSRGFSFVGDIFARVRVLLCVVCLCVFLVLDYWSATCLSLLRLTWAYVFVLFVDIRKVFMFDNQRNN